MPKEDKSQTRIIVVEDDRDINELIAYNLRKEGFPVEQAYDGLAARQILRQKQFDIVVLDIMLPGIDGFDICKELKGTDLNPKTFIIVVSVKNSQQDKLYAHILGADCYLTKPFLVADLVSIVKEINAMLHKEFTVKTK